MRSSDHCNERHFGNRADESLDLGGIDPLASRLDQILGATGDDQVTGGIDAREIARRKPSFGIGGRVLIAEIALDDGCATHAQMPLATSLLRNRVTFSVREQEIDADGRASRQMSRA